MSDPDDQDFSHAATGGDSVFSVREARVIIHALRRLRAALTPEETGVLDKLETQLSWAEEFVASLRKTDEVTK